MHMADLPPYSTPRWVKIFGIIALILILLIVVVLVTGLGGEHGPSRHIPSGDAGGDTPRIEQEVQLDGPMGHTLPIEHGRQQS
jgi:hypothetical protein